MSPLRTARSRAAVQSCVSVVSLLCFLTIAPASAQQTSRGAAGTARRAVRPRTDSGDVIRQSPAAAAAEEARYYREALALRARILRRASWASFDTTTCNIGSLRIFPSDTTVANEVKALERRIIARGIENSIDTPAGHDLLNTMIGWEAAVTRPEWDVPAGEKPRQAIAAGLTGLFFNPDTKRCESYVGSDTVVVIVPEAPHFQPARYPKVVLEVASGDTGLRHARDLFFATAGRDTSAIFTYSLVGPVVIWRDFAVVGVNRPAEQRAVVRLAQGAGGGAYIFHRVGTAWRLLAISQTWGR